MPTQSNSEHGRAPLVLVADDDRAVRYVLCEILEEGGFRTVEAGDGLEAARHCQGLDRPDLVLLDIHMPRLDGLGFLEAASAWEPLPRTIVVSATTDPTARVRALELGAKAYLAKPFDPKDVIATAREVLRN